MEIYLDHVRANVSNLSSSIRWYKDIPGLKVTGYWPRENPNYAHFGFEKGATFAIMEHKEVPSQGRFNFKVENVDVFWEQIKDKVTVVEECFDTPYGSRKFTIKDLRQ